MINKNIVKKIAVLKLCCLGDIVFITPAIKNLKTNFPDAEIVLVSSEWVKNIVNLIPGIDRNIIFNFSESSFFLRKVFFGFKLLKIIRKEKFDLALLGHRTSYLGIILFLSGIKYRLGFSKTKFINYKAPFDENIHETKRYLKILENSNLKIYFEKPELRRPNINVKKNKNIIIGIFPFGGINPGTEMKIKRWDVENYILLIKLIYEKYNNIEVILFEGKTEKEKFSEQKLLPNVLIKKIDIDLISLCDIFVAGDTGPLHIAAAIGISTLGIFGPSSPELVAPINFNENHSSSNHIYIWKRLECSPCYTPSTAIDRRNKKYWDGNNFICFKGTNECIKNVTVNEVFFELNKIIDLVRLKFK